MHRAGFWIRTLAAVIDLVIGFLPAYLLSVAVMTSLWDSAGSARAYAAAAVSIDLILLLYSSFEIWTAGTPGKLILRLRIRALDGSPADFWRRFLRWSTKQLWLIAGLLWALTGFVPFYALSGFMSGIVAAGCLFAANEDHLTWHDQWAGTAVYRIPKQRQPAQPTPASSALPP